MTSKNRFDHDVEAAIAADNRMTKAEEAKARRVAVAVATAQHEHFVNVFRQLFGKLIVAADARIEPTGCRALFTYRGRQYQIFRVSRDFTTNWEGERTGGGYFEWYLGPVGEYRFNRRILYDTDTIPEHEHTDGYGLVIKTVREIDADFERNKKC